MTVLGSPGWSGLLSLEAAARRPPYEALYATTSPAAKSGGVGSRSPRFSLTHSSATLLLSSALCWS